MPKIQLTTQVVSTYQPPTGTRKVDLFDVQTKGLVLEVRESGGKTYYLRYRDARQRVRTYKLADARDVTLTQARALADKARNRIAMGEDPCESKKAVQTVPTFGSFINDQYLPYVKSYKRSWDTDESLIRNHLLPRFANHFLDEITRQDIVKMHSTRLNEGAAPGSANRLLVMMRYIFNLAIRWDVPNIKTNPTKGVPLFEENNKKERYLTSEETQRLYDAVCKSESTMLQFIIPMLLLTGARKREVLDAKWQDFDLIQRSWRIPTPKSGVARYVPLSDGALNILRRLTVHDEHDYVFANPKSGKPFVSIHCAWDSARKRAGLKDVRIHDLRHSFASMLVNNGRTLYEVQNILGHTQIKTTQRYSHLSNETLIAAANAACNSLGNMLTPQAPLALSLQAI